MDSMDTRKNNSGIDASSQPQYLDSKRNFDDYGMRPRSKLRDGKDDIDSPLVTSARSYKTQNKPTMLDRVAQNTDKRYDDKKDPFMTSSSSSKKAEDKYDLYEGMLKSGAVQPSLKSVLAKDSPVKSANRYYDSYQDNKYSSSSSRGPQLDDNRFSAASDVPRTFGNRDRVPKLNELYDETWLVPEDGGHEGHGSYRKSDKYSSSGTSDQKHRMSDYNDFTSRLGSSSPGNKKSKQPDYDDYMSKIGSANFKTDVSMNRKLATPTRDSDRYQDYNYRDTEKSHKTQQFDDDYNSSRFESSRSYKPTRTPHNVRTELKDDPIYRSPPSCEDDYNLSRHNTANKSYKSIGDSELSNRYGRISSSLKYKEDLMRDDDVDYRSGLSMHGNKKDLHMYKDEGLRSSMKTKEGYLLDKSYRNSDPKYFDASYDDFRSSEHQDDYRSERRYEHDFDTSNKTLTEKGKYNASKSNNSGDRYSDLRGKSSTLNSVAKDRDCVDAARSRSGSKDRSNHYDDDVRENWRKARPGDRRGPSASDDYDFFVGQDPSRRSSELGRDKKIQQNSLMADFSGTKYKIGR